MSKCRSWMFFDERVERPDEATLVRIDEPMIVDEASARSRAIKELVERGLRRRTIRFRTVATGIMAGMTVRVRGVSWRVTDAELVVDGKRYYTDVQGERYEW